MSEPKRMSDERLQNFREAHGRDNAIMSWKVVGELFAHIDALTAEIATLNSRALVDEEKQPGVTP